MPVDLSDTLIVAVSARALFDLEADTRLFREKGLEAYGAFQRENENRPVLPGPAFPLIRGLLALNARSVGLAPLVEVIIVSSQHPDIGVRLLNSVKHYGLPITRAAFTGGAPTTPLLSAFQVDLLLTRSESDSQHAVDAGIAAAVMYDLPADFTGPEARQPLTVAFDGDAVIFSDDAEAFYQAHGLEKFEANEAANAHVPLPEGPFGKLLRSLARVRAAAPQLLRIALVTARSGPAHERALRRPWCMDRAWVRGRVEWGWSVPMTDGDTALALQSEQGSAPPDPAAAASGDELGRV